MNAELLAAQAVLIDIGLDKNALKAAIKYAETPEEKREQFDLSYQFSREALGFPVQADLFSATIQRQTQKHTENKPH